MNLNISSDKVVENLSYYYVLVNQKLSIWIKSLAISIPNIIAALIIITLFIVLSGIVNKVSYKFLNRFTESPALKKLLPMLLSWVVIGVGITVCLSVLNLEKAVFSLLAGAGIIGVVLGFAFQDLAVNFIAGIYLTFMQPFREGDIIKTSEYFGRVDKLNLRSTILHTFDGQTVILPNRTIFEKPLINYNKTGKRRIEIKIPFSYTQDLEQVTELLYKQINELDYVLKNEEIDISAYEFGNYSINMVIYFWVNYPNSEKSFAQAKHTAMKAIKNALDEAGIIIPIMNIPSYNPIGNPPSYK
jgi:small-conductance mechanosensitive channel